MLHRGKESFMGRMSITSLEVGLTADVEAEIPLAHKGAIKSMRAQYC